jgi:hypothetical protein
VALGSFGAVLLARSLQVRTGLVFAVLGAAAWVGLFESGFEPVVIGLAMGLLAYAFAAPRSSLERATERFREFREQPNAQLARAAGLELRLAAPINERLQRLFHPLDELRDRAAVRARERAHRRRRRVFGASFQLADHARHPLISLAVDAAD